MFETHRSIFLTVHDYNITEKIKNIVIEFYGQLPPAPKARVTFPLLSKGCSLETVEENLMNFSSC